MGGGGLASRPMTETEVRWRARTEAAFSAASRSHWREKVGLTSKHGVDAFGGEVKARGMREQGRRIEVVEDGDVDLAGAAAGGVDHEGGGGAVAPGEIAIEELEPVLLGGVTHC